MKNHGNYLNSLTVNQLFEMLTPTQITLIKTMLEVNRDMEPPEAWNVYEPIIEEIEQLLK